MPLIHTLELEKLEQYLYQKRPCRKDKAVFGFTTFTTYSALVRVPRTPVRIASERRGGRHPTDSGRCPRSQCL